MVESNLRHLDDRLIRWSIVSSFRLAPIQFSVLTSGSASSSAAKEGRGGEAIILESRVERLDLGTTGGLETSFRRRFLGWHRPLGCRW